MKKKNLLYIFTDEQAHNTIEALGYNHIQTPNLNRLAGMSHVFTHCYCTQPVCTPSRASLMTGKYPHSHASYGNNVLLNPVEKCLPELEGFADYKTAYIGKWHLGNELFPQHGFNEWISIEDNYNDHFTKEYDPTTRSHYHHFLIKNGFVPDKIDIFGTPCFSREFCAKLPEQFTKAAFTANEAVKYIQKTGEEPFFLCVNFLEPHMPFFGPRDNMYDPKDISLPLNFEHIPDNTHTKRAALLHYGFKKGIKFNTSFDSPEKWKALIARYWGLISMVDCHVGRILDALDEKGLTDDTLIVFTSDHGDMMGSHGLIAKELPYEECTRVPLMIKLPEQKKGSIIEHNVGSIDLAPTLLDALNMNIPESMEGYSLLPTMCKGLPPTCTDVFIEWNVDESDIEPEIPHIFLEINSKEEILNALRVTSRTIVSPDGLKYTRNKGEGDLLFDLKNDPYEMKNCIHDPIYAAPLEEMKKRLTAWQIRTNDF